MSNNRFMSSIEEQIQQLESESLLATAPCHEGAMPFRTWQPWGDQMGGELIVMLHDGSGAWNHWIRNVSVLSDYYELVVPDLPGLGDAASVADGTDPQGIAEIVAAGLTSVLGPRRFHLIAFSWGSAVASLVAPLMGEQVKSIMLVGPASLGKMPEPRRLRLLSKSSSMTADEISEVNRENLARLMIHDRAKIDQMAVTLHNINTARARYNSPRFSEGDYVLQGLKQTSANLLVLYGSEDAVAVPNLEEKERRIRAIRPDVSFETREGAGHWLQYEDAKWFNRRVVDWIEANIFS
jgi:2-hydroxy-6-oxonona-2,4-dienedioate hydrolase